MRKTWLPLVSVSDVDSQPTPSATLLVGTDEHESQWLQSAVMESAMAAIGTLSRCSGLPAPATVALHSMQQARRGRDPVENKPYHRRGVKTPSEAELGERDEWDERGEFDEEGGREGGKKGGASPEL